MALIDGEPFSRRVIGCAIEVHRTLGPGLLESIYEACLRIELEQQGLALQRQRQIPVIYKGQTLDGAFRPDLIVEQTLLVEVKAVHTILPIHDAQLLTYLKVSGLHTGLLLNFSEPRLIDGVRRRLL
jgi:GxxExxY protein